jgi:hypothetical protein
LRIRKLRFGRTKTGRRRVGVTRTKTYLVPEVGIFQRVGPGATRLVYAFTRGKKLEPRLRFVATAKKESDRWFREEMEKEVLGAIARAKGRGL